MEADVAISAAETVADGKLMVKAKFAFTGTADDEASVATDKLDDNELRWTGRIPDGMETSDLLMARQLSSL